MSKSEIRYDLLTQDALRSVVRKVLEDTAKSGLPGDHHFYISFHTQAEGVKLPKRLLARFPDDMTIVLQHHFDNLIVNERGFEVGLSFDSIMERIGVPFAAIKGFYDPSVEFGMQFEQDLAVADARADEPVAEAAQPAAAKPAVAEVDSAASGDDAAAGGAQVLSLDRYRKK